MVDNQVLYKNETGFAKRRRGGEEVRPGESFQSTHYEPADAGFTIIEDNLPPVVRSSEEVAATSTPQKVDIPGPLRSVFMEVTVQAVSDGARIEVGFNRPDDPTAPVDTFTKYNERVDTRRAWCLYLSGSGTARVIFKEVLC